MMHIHYQQEILIPSTAEGLNECLDMVYKLTKQFNFDLETSFSLHTVIIESVENAIIHGNKFIKDFNVRVLIVVCAHEIFVEVEDKGAGFDMNSVPSPIEGSAIQQEGGRGIFFIRRLSLSCYTMGRGNIIRIKLKR
jgi:serine/threonine-protein kinase RsbW